jgi:hypothetical protein
MGIIVGIESEGGVPALAEPFVEPFDKPLNSEQVRRRKQRRVVERHEAGGEFGKGGERFVGRSVAEQDLEYADVADSSRETIGVVVAIVTDQSGMRLKEARSEAVEIVNLEDCWGAKFAVYRLIGKKRIGIDRITELGVA